jgi:hypothetical protein
MPSSPKQKLHGHTLVIRPPHFSLAFDALFAVWIGDAYNDDIALGKQINTGHDDKRSAKTDIDHSAPMDPVIVNE